MKIPRSDLITEETIEYIKTRMAGQHDLSHDDYNLLHKLVKTVMGQSQLHSWNKTRNG